MVDLQKGEADSPVVLRLAHVVHQEAPHRTAELLELHLCVRKKFARLDIESLARQEARLDCPPEDRQRKSFRP
jgi:hypothetical protein